MPTSVSFSANIMLGDGKRVWQVKPSGITQIDGRNFVAIHPHNYSFVNLVAEGTQLQRDLKTSLAQSPQLLELITRRNEAQREALLEAVTPGAAKLFAGAGARADEADARKRMRLSRAELRKQRDSPGLVVITVPSLRGLECKDIHVCRSSTGRETLRIPLESDALDHILMYIRDGLTEMDTARRCYLRSGEPGVWTRAAKEGSRYCTKQANGRMKYFNSIDDALAVEDDAGGDDGDLHEQVHDVEGDLHADDHDSREQVDDGDEVADDGEHSRADEGKEFGGG
jgi:hypothetical protein